jgi:ABC-type polar amino acid transport system ATPase subunit
MAGHSAVNETVLSISGLRLSRPGRVVIDGLDLHVARGEFVALMGLSGGGKTTLLRTIVALEPFDAGVIQVGGVSLHPGPLPPQSSLGPLRHGVGIVFQFHHLFGHLTALENVTLAPIHARRLSREVAEHRARGLLDSLGVLARANAMPAQLSGGEAQRVAIARALATDPELLLLDEPTASLDPARRAELGDSLRGLMATGCTLLVTTHDHGFVRQFASRVVILADGAVVDDGDPEHVLDHSLHPSTRQLFAANPANERRSPTGATPGRQP